MLPQKSDPQIVILRCCTAGMMNIKFNSFINKRTNSAVFICFNEIGDQIHCQHLMDIFVA